MTATRSARPGERLHLPSLHDALCIPAGEFLLAVFAEDAAQFGFGVIGEHALGGQFRGRIHPHVERGVLGVGEAPIDAVELQGGDPEVEQDAVNLGQPESGDGIGDAVVHGVHKVHPVAERGETSSRDLESVGVTVEADQGQAGKSAEEGLRVARHAESRVDQHGALSVERGGEQLEGALEEHGGVDGGIVHRCPVVLTPDPHPI